ncbi:MAG: DUF1439 domain-containing protein [Dokdonella sp.]
MGKESVSTNFPLASRKIFAAALVIIVVGLACTYAYFVGRTYEVRITEADLRAKVASRFPLTKSLLILQAKLSNPRIALVEGSNRVALGIDLELNLHASGNAEPLGGKADVEASLRYEPAAGAFYLDAPEIRRLDLQGVSEKYTPLVRDAVREALVHDFAKHPAYTLGLSNMKTAVARLVLRKVVVDHGVLILTLGV